MVRAWNPQYLCHQCYPTTLTTRLLTTLSAQFFLPSFPTYAQFYVDSDWTAKKMEVDIVDVPEDLSLEVGTQQSTSTGRRG